MQTFSARREGGSLAATKVGVFKTILIKLLKATKLSLAWDLSCVQKHQFWYQAWLQEHSNKR